MKIAKKRIISVIICICIVLGLVVDGIGTYKTMATPVKNEALSGTEASGKTLKSNVYAQRGTEDNPFVVLEVVPTLEQAQFGYLIPGCEPVDLDVIEQNYETVSSLLNTVSGMYNLSNEVLYSYYEEIPEDTEYYVFAGLSGMESTEAYSVRTFSNGYYAGANGVGVSNCWYQDSSDTKCTEVGYFKKVAAGSGKFRMEEISTASSYQYNKADITINGDVKSYSFVYDEKQGDYNWVASTNRPENANSVDDPAQVSELTEIWTTRDDLFKCQTNKLVHKDEFISKVLGADSATFISKVVTTTPEILAENLDLIDQADLIYFHTANASSETKTLWNYASENGSHTLDDVPSVGFADHDLTNETVIRIMSRMASSTTTSLIFEMPAMWQNGDTTLNTYKLTLMAMQYTPNDFVNTYGLLSAIETASSGSDKLVYNGSSEWSQDTLRYGTDGTDLKDNMRYYAVNTSNHNVLERIYTMDGSKSLLQEIIDNADISVKHDTSGNGNYMQDLYDYYGDDEKSSHTTTDALRYVLSGAEESMPKIRVLEIQPCQQFIYTEDSKGNATWTDEAIEYYEGLFPDYHPTTDKKSWVMDTDLLEVTTMPTWEFVGSTGRYTYAQTDANGNPILLTTDSSDDLISKFDMIVIGSKQDASNGLNGYNDSNLGHLIYNAVGDLVKLRNKTENTLSGNDKHYLTRAQINIDNTRYSGNDITLKKMLELEDFLRAGKPIVVDKTLYKDALNKKVDTTKVDKSSKLYDLLNWKDTDSNADNNLLVYGSYSSKKIKNLITKSQCNIVFYNDEDAYPLEYSYEEDSDGGIKSENYQARDEEGNAIMTFHFYVAGSSSYTYQLSLNIDADGDGVYGGSLKQLAEVKNMSAATGKQYSSDTSEKALAVTVYEVRNGKKVELGSSKSVTLNAYQEYYATYELPENQLGIVPWKLEVNAVSNTCLRSSAIDYTAFALGSEASKTKINVLQMSLSHDMTEDWYTSSFTSFTKYRVDLGSSTVWNTVQSVYYKNHTRHYYNSDYDYTSSSISLGLSNSNVLKTVTKFEDYIGNVGEFDVNIQYMRNEEWVELFGTGAIDSSGKQISDEQKLANWEDFLSQYDMIVLGFIDGDSFTDNEIFVNGFKDFVAQGKGVILSHDTVGSSNFLYEPNKDRFYYGFGTYTPWLRTVSGQRRAYYNYDSTTGTYKKSYMEKYSNGTLVDTQKTVTDRLKTLTDTRFKRQYYQFTQDVDGDVIESELIGTYAKEIIDNSNQLYARRVTATNTSTGLKADRVTQSNGGNATGNWPTSVAGTTNVRLTNNGQITTYPYQLDEIITVLPTHTQNYQLDMEYLEGGDVNVWFNLTDNYDPLVTNLYTNNNTDEFSARSLDSRNSFYIYNKGNITYTGSGHSGNSVMPDDEVKLFINTMISAYRAPEDSPYAVVENADSTSSDDTAMVYVDDEGADDRIVTINGQQMVKVEIAVYDSSESTSTSGKKFYMTVKEGTGSTVTTLDVYAEDGTPTPSDDGNGKYTVQSKTDGAVYVVYIPYDDVVNDGSVDFSIDVSSSYTRSGRDRTTDTSTTKVSVTLLPLFDLN